MTGGHAENRRRRARRTTDGIRCRVIVRADRREPLVVLPLRLAAEVANAAEKFRGNEQQEAPAK